MPFQLMDKRVIFCHKTLPYVLLAPQVLVTLVFIFLPTAQTLWQAFHMENPVGTASSFVGFHHFRELFSSSHHAHAFRLTAWFSLLVALLGLGLALLLATLADRVLRGARIYQTLLIWPYAVAAAVSGVMGLFLFSPSVGIWAVVLASVWKQVSWNFLFFLIGLQTIPRSLIEAAAIDGAGPLRRFWTIVFPLLLPTTFLLFLMNMIHAFLETFAMIDIMTQGGPDNRTSILVYNVYQASFKHVDMGSSAAQSVILMLIVIMLSLVQFLFINRHVNNLALCDRSQARDS